MNPILKAHLEGVEIFEKTFCKVGPGGELPNVAYSKPIIAFLTTYGTNLLKAAKEAGPKERTAMNPLPNPYYAWGNYDGHNSCLSTFTSAIDEGIKGIKGKAMSECKHGVDVTDVCPKCDKTTINKYL